MTCNGTRASAPTPSSPDRIAPKSLRDPVRALMASILCHSVIIVTLFPHVTGGHIKNIAAASCHSTVGSDVTDLTSMYHCPECDPSLLDSEVNSSRLPVLLIACELIVCERFRGVRQATHDPVVGAGSLKESDGALRSSGTDGAILYPWVGKKRKQVRIPPEDNGGTIPSAAPPRPKEDRPRSVPPTSAKAHLAPSTVVRLTKVLWPTLDGATVTWEDVVGERSPRAGSLSGSSKNEEIGTLWYSWESWLGRKYCDLNFVATLISEQNSLVSLHSYTQTHLFSPHTDPTTTEHLVAEKNDFTLPPQNKVGKPKNWC